MKIQLLVVKGLRMVVPLAVQIRRSYEGEEQGARLYGGTLGLFR